MTDIDSDRDKYLQSCVELGKTEGLARFLGLRSQWLADENSVRLQETDDGHWDIVLRIDGTYVHQDHAEEVAEAFQAEVWGLAAQIHADHMAAYVVETEAPCPVCGKDSVLVGRQDRYFHADGTDNDRCWVAIHRGEVTR